MKNGLKILSAAAMCAAGCGVVLPLAIHFWFEQGAHSPVLFGIVVLCSFFGPLLLGRFLTQAERG